MKALVCVAVVLVATSACDTGETGSGSGGAEGVDVATTVVVEEVALTLAARAERHVVRGYVEVMNSSDADVVVRDPSALEREEDGRRVARFPVADPGFSDARGAADAPPRHTGVFVSAGSSVDFDVAVAGSPERGPVELCVEVLGASNVVGSRVDGSQVTVPGRDPAAPARVACSGPVEIAEESFDDPVGEE